jgi:hypothetical protein
MTIVAALAAMLQGAIPDLAAESVEKISRRVVIIPATGAVTSTQAAAASLSARQ